MKIESAVFFCVAGLLLTPAVPAVGPIGSNDPLTFFEGVAPESLYRFEAEIVINELSLETGLVDTHTCHHNLDPIDRVEIMFSKDRLNDLEIVSHQGIGQVSRNEHLVSLRDVTRGASICIFVRTRSLEPLGEGYVLKGGPLQRRFLDSFHPMMMHGTVHLGTHQLAFNSMSPDRQPGWTIDVGPGRIEYGGFFAGTLQTEIRFDRIRALADVSPQTNTPQT